MFISLHFHLEDVCNSVRNLTPEFAFVGSLGHAPAPQFVLGNQAMSLHFHLHFWIQIQILYLMGHQAVGLSTPDDIEFDLPCS